MILIALTIAKMEWTTIASESMPSHQMNIISMFIPADCEMKWTLYQSFVLCDTNEYLLLIIASIAFANDTRSTAFWNCSDFVSKFVKHTAWSCIINLLGRSVGLLIKIEPEDTIVAVKRLFISNFSSNVWTNINPLHIRLGGAPRAWCGTLLCKVPHARFLSKTNSYVGI